MSPMVPKLTDKQLDLVDKALRHVWVFAIGGALTVAALVYLLARLTPPPMGP